MMVEWREWEKGWRERRLGVRKEEGKEGRMLNSKIIERSREKKEG